MHLFNINYKLLIIIINITMKAKTYIEVRQTNDEQFAVEFEPTNLRPGHSLVTMLLSLYTYIYI